MSQTLELRPLDARLARILVRPLIGTRVTPNDLTTLRLVLGLVAADGLAAGSPAWASASAWMFALSNFVDHADGELARLSGRTSRWGHCYDLASDALIHVLLFAALGYGLRGDVPGVWTTLLGAVAGVAVAFIFWLHMYMEQILGAQGARLPAAGAFEIEDVMYLFPLVTIFDIRLPFLVVAAIGAPLFVGWLGFHFRRVSAAHRGQI